MKTMFALLLVIAALPVSAQTNVVHNWTLKSGAAFSGDYYTSGALMVVIKSHGTNCFLKISDLSTNDWLYFQDCKAAQRQRQLDAEVAQMRAAGWMEFTKEALIKCNTQFLTRLMNENNQSQSINQWGWMDADYVEPTSTTFWVDANSPPITASFCVVDKNQIKLDIYCLDVARVALTQTIAGLKHGDKIRLIGVALPAGGGIPAFEISKIELIESAANTAAGEKVK